MPEADAHLHLFVDGYAGRLGISPAGGDELDIYERLRSRHGISRGLVLGYEAEPWCVGNTEHILHLARTRPWMVPLAYLPATPPTIADLHRFRERGASGIALYPANVNEGGSLAEWPAEAVDAINEASAIVSVNADPAVLTAASPLLERLVGCQILISHLGQPGAFAAPPSPSEARQIVAPVLALSTHEHVHVKFSGLYGVSQAGHDFPHSAAWPFVDVLLDRFGPHRMLWGSDFAPALDDVSFEQTADPRALRGCSADEVTAVMGANLLRLLAGRETSSRA